MHDPVDESLRENGLEILEIPVVGFDPLDDFSYRNIVRRVGGTG
jgi:hypothetical protein